MLCAVYVKCFCNNPSEPWNRVKMVTEFVKINLMLIWIQLGPFVLAGISTGYTSLSCLYLRIIDLFMRNIVLKMGHKLWATIGETNVLLKSVSQWDKIPNWDKKITQLGLLSMGHTQFDEMFHWSRSYRLWRKFSSYCLETCQSWACPYLGLSWSYYRTG